MLRHLAQIAQAEHLVAARVGQDRPRPLHELVQSTERPHGLIPGPQHQVERVAEQDLGADVLEHPRRHAFHGAVGSAWHENRRLDRAMCRGQAPAPCLTVGRQHVERHARSTLAEHRVAVAEEPVALRHGHRVGPADALDPGERGDQHEQRRLRQVEVRDQRIDRLEAIAGRDEQPRLAAVHAGRGSGFQGAHHGGADRHDASPAGLDRAPCRRRYGVALRVHAVAAQVLHAHRLERAGADVQRDAGYANALRLQTAEDRVVEVQAGRGGGDSARNAGVDRLVAILVRRVGLAVDVRRQRHAAETLEIGRDGLAEIEPVELALAPDHRDCAVANEYRSSRLERLAGPHLAERLALPVEAFDDDLRLAAGILAADQAGLDDARVVDHEEVSRVEQIDDRLETAMPNRVASQFEQTAARAVRRWSLGNQLVRQLEAEVRALHAFSHPRAPATARQRGAAAHRA